MGARRGLTGGRLRAVLLLLATLAVAPGARAQPSDAQFAQAGKLLAQCSQLDEEAKRACADLSKAVVNGRDPAALLPTVDQIVAGDIHVFGPWSASIVLRRKPGAGVVAYAVVASATGPDIVITKVADAATASALMKGAVQSTTVTAVTPEASGHAAAGGALPASMAQGWVTEVRPTLVPDGSLLSEDVLARYVGPDPAELPLGDYLDAMPVRSMFSQVSYVRSGLFRATEAGEYRFSIGFLPPDLNAVDKWECWPHLALLDGGKRQALLASQPVEVDPGIPADRLGRLISSPVTLPAGLSALELSVQCAMQVSWNPNAAGTYLRTRGYGRQGSPWPTLLLQVQRPSDPAPSPVRVDEIVYDTQAHPGLRTAPALRALAEEPGAHDAMRELSLPSAFHSGWYIDTYPIVGAANTAWSLPPTAPLETTFFAPAGGFTLADHLRQGGSQGGGQRDGRIYVANSEFLALADGRYSFMVVADNPGAPALKDYGDCVVELLVTDRDGNVTKMIQGTASNTTYWTGPNGVDVAAFGGATLGRGAYRLALRAACLASQVADITVTPLAETRFSVFVREPTSFVVHPPNPGVLVYRTR